ncbi:hypothetical protein K466DRAFT_607218, partial [Polyporus arcularius HHB13444]
DSESSVEPEPDSEEERAIRQGFVVHESDFTGSVELEPDTVVPDVCHSDGSTLPDTVAEECSSSVIDWLHSVVISAPHDGSNRTSPQGERRHDSHEDEEQPRLTKRRKVSHIHSERARKPEVPQRSGSAPQPQNLLSSSDGPRPLGVFDSCARGSSTDNARALYH